LDAEFLAVVAAEPLEVVRMSELFSEHWHRVRELRPRLAPDVAIAQHVYRGKSSTVIQRQSTGEIHRMDANAYALVQELDGRVSVEEWWMRMLASDVEDVPTQPEILAAMASLHEAGVLIVDRSLDAEQLFARAKEHDRRDRFGRYSNPLFIRLSLGDPTAVLKRLSAVGALLFSVWGAIALGILLLLAVVTILPSMNALELHWQRLEALSFVSGFGVFVVYPMLKMIHELAHGLALRRFGVRCTEAGLAMLVLLPIPYVDASASAMLPNKRQRMLISAAGVLAELGVAAIAVLVWSATSGLVQDLALVVILVGGLSTILFNGNPLLKFDGYYLLADAVEVPNLARRANRYVLHIVRRWILGFDDGFAVGDDRKERVWLIGYAVLSTLYRLVLTFAIAMMLFGQYFFFGVILAGWAIIVSVLLPLWRSLKFIFTDTRVKWARAIPISTTAFVLMVVGLCVVPVTQATVVQGVVWLPDNALVRAPGNCEITDVATPTGTHVEPGTALLLCEDFALRFRQSQLLAELDAAHAKSAGLQLTDRMAQLRLQHEISSLEAQIEHLDGVVSRQLAHAAVEGKFLARTDIDLLGQYVTRGEVLGYVVPHEERTVRLALKEQDIHLLDGKTKSSKSIVVRWYEQGRAASHATSVSRQTPNATYEVPTAALTERGGGELVADPSGDGRQVLDPVFDIELTWPIAAPALPVGQHVVVRFHGESRPLVYRWADALQRIFMQESTA